MLNPRNDLLPPPSSPTNSSISSSDLDTESTGSFFHDRSTTLGTLMGVSFPVIAFRAPSQRHHADDGSIVGTPVSSRKSKKPKKKNNTSICSSAMVVAERRRRRWWRLCRDDGAKSASLGDFLEVERRFGECAFYDTAAELEGVVMADRNRNGRSLFEDGRVLPPPPTDVDDRTDSSGAICRFSVSLTGICSGCVG